MNILGFVSGIVLLFAFYLISNKKLDGQSYFYQFMVFSGSLGIATECIYNKAFGSVFLQVSCCLVSLFVVIRRYIKERK